MNKLKVFDLTFIGIFAGIIAICSWITIPSPIPFTMQTFGIFLSFCTLGGKKSVLAVLTYLLIGLAGAPVFSGFSGGAGYLAGATGGFVFGFLFGSISMWLTEKLPLKKYKKLFSMAVGLVVCYICGVMWFLFIYTENSQTISIYTVISTCVLPYIIPDIIKLALADTASKRISNYISKRKG